MSVSRKDFEAVATAINGVYRMYVGRSDQTGMEAVEASVFGISARFADANPRFNPARFRAACFDTSPTK